MAMVLGKSWPMGALCAGMALLGVLSEAVPGGQTPQKPPVKDRFVPAARNAMATYCAPCHGGATPAGKAQLARAKTEEDVRQAPEVWARAAENLRSGRMPPPGSKAPSAAERAAIADALDAIVTDCKAPDPGRVTLRRLNRYEYDRTIRDLVGVDLPLSADFPSDDVGEGFDNIGDVLSISTLLMEKYLDAAEKVAEKAIVLPRRQTLRIEGEDLQSDQGRPGSSGEQVLSSNGEVFGVRALTHGGTYQIRVRAFAQQAGPDPARMSVRVDGKEIALFDVRAVRSKPMDYEVPVTLEAGRHRVAAAFTNDYYKPDAPNPADRDRNLHVDSILIIGPNDGIVALPASHTRLVVAAPGDGLTRVDATRKVLGAFASRAYRRPATPEEVERLVAVALAAAREGEPFERGIQLGVTAALVSPQFLFRVELDPPATPGGEIRDLNDYEIASRLSYFLWGSMPDDRLFALAAQGSLRKPAVRSAEVARMLKDPKARSLAESFADQWLQLRKLEIVSPDPTRFPSFDAALKADMRQETQLFFNAVVDEDRNVMDFVDGKFTFVSARLAKHYGMPAVTGTGFKRVALDGVRRAGVLTQGSVLTVTSNPTRTSPVKRGKWILEQFLGTPPPPPPPGVDDLSEERGVLTAATLRELMVKHRADPTCASCHARMDPLGFGLENFDAVGAWRSVEGKTTIDASGVLPDGSKFVGPQQLRAILRKRKEAFVRTLTQKLMVYGLGRGLTFADRCAVDAIEAEAAKQNYKFSALIQGIVASEPFLKRRG